ncbi:MAG: hypothetical protein SGI83_17120 [Bacteroidota bacterium]|nr:hypothetical protein [Bacteroidota bacterium]
MKEQLLATWLTHHKMNDLLINAITDTGMLKTLSNRSCRTIYQQWIHIHNVRMQWLEICAKDIFTKYTPLNKDAAFDRTSLEKALEESAAGIAALLTRSWEQGGKVKGFKKGVLPLFDYFISHESQHREIYS